MIQFPNQVIHWKFFPFLLPLGVVTSGTLKGFALFISPDLCKLPLQINTTEAKIIL